MNLPVAPSISVIIPNHNGEKTIGRCLDAAFASQYSNFEVIVVDDCSTDSSTTVIEKYPCRLIRLSAHGGASKARNTGAQNSTDEVLFFIDNDCLLQSDTLTKAAGAYQEEGPGVIIGGTYTQLPYDQKFFSIFQSVYIHYSETKNTLNPDYVATHAMLIAKDLFQKSGGFNEQFMPILEDVEFSHRLKKMGAKLRMVPEIQVQHIFDFTLAGSMRNGIKKSKYWSIYSIKNRDLLSDLIEQYERGNSAFQAALETTPSPVSLLADAAVHQASADPKSVVEPVQRIRELVQTIVDGKIRDGQLSEAPLTFRELSLIQEQFVKVVAGMFHHRLEYPATRHLTESSDAEPEPSGEEAGAPAFR